MSSAFQTTLSKSGTLIMPQPFCKAFQKNAEAKKKILMRWRYLNAVFR